jgi:uncharacterized membrane protein
MLSMRLFSNAVTTGSFTGWIEIAIKAIEGLAVAIIIITVFLATVRFLYYLLVRRASTIELTRQYKHSLGRALLVSLELLVAADVVYTVVLEFSFANAAALGLLVLVRTFLSWSLVVEIEGRWPWQPVRHEDGVGEL